jgi:glycosyltransferase involved in cell wall biosynthesis
MLKTAGTLNKLGYQVCLHCLNRKDTTVATRVEGYPFEIMLLPNPRFELMRAGKWSAVVEDGEWSRFAQVAARNVLEHIERNPPQFLLSHDAMGFAIGGELYHHFDKGTFSWIHDIPEYTRGDMALNENFRDFLSITEEKLIHCPDALTSVSSMLNEILRDFYSLETKPSLVLNAPRCSDFDQYYPRDVRTAVNIPQNVPLLVYSGGVRPLRSLETLVEALPLLPNVHVAIVTNSAERFLVNLKRVAQELGVKERIHFHSYVPFYNVTSFLRTATVGINPILRYSNAELGIFQKALEYLHAGLPQVVSNNRAMEEFVSQHDCGLAFEAGNAHSLAEAVTHVLDRLNSEPSWHQSIKALSEQYCWEKQETVITDIYDTLAPNENSNNDLLHKESNYRVFHLPTVGANQLDNVGNTAKNFRVSAPSKMIGGHRAKNDADYALKNVSNNLIAGGQILSEVVEEYDAFHFHGWPLSFSYRYAYQTGMDWILLRAAGKKIFLHLCGGGDILDNKIRNFRDRRQRLFVEFASGICNGVFVTDPELQKYVHGALIVPRILDLEEWSSIDTNPSEVLRVACVPLWRGAKVDRQVLSVVDKLKTEDIRIELRLIKNVSNEETMEICKWADVVIDQLMVGWYSDLAVEAMALGKAVVCCIQDGFRHYLPYPLPLAIASCENLYHVLRDLALSPEKTRSLGLQGRKYAEELHDVKKINEILPMIYEAELNPFDIDKVVKLFSFQSRPLISRASIKKLMINRSLVSKLWMSKAYINKRSFISFFRMLRRDGVRCTMREAYHLFFGDKPS